MSKSIFHKETEYTLEELEGGKSPYIRYFPEFEVCWQYEGENKEDQIHYSTLLRFEDKNGVWWDLPFKVLKKMYIRNSLMSIKYKEHLIEFYNRAYRTLMVIDIDSLIENNSQTIKRSGIQLNEYDRLYMIERLKMGL